MALLVSQSPPCVLHEDEHLLVILKPAGLNTHSPSPFAGEGIFDWLRHREPRWADLAIIHRLDKATSGVMVFAKTKLANQSLTRQFTDRSVHKTYLFLTSTAPQEKSFTVRAPVTRAGDRYRTSPHGEPAETNFAFVRKEGPHFLFRAEPITGRTHQIRLHAELKEIPILGDTTYNGAPFPRVCLHAHEISFEHPGTKELTTFRAEPDFFAPPHLDLRAALIDPEVTNAFRWINGAADLHPGLYLDQWANTFLAQTTHEKPNLSEIITNSLKVDSPSTAEIPKSPSVYHKLLTKNINAAQDAQPQHLSGPAAPEPFTILENGVRYEISFQQGYSVGLFLDQRENRRRLLHNYVGPKFHLFDQGLRGREVLNTFAYTCGFSLCAALAGARSTSLDLSKKYLEWGKRNFHWNNIDPAAHDFIFGDLFDWAPRLVKKGRLFDLVLLDPPTFSRAKSGGTFQAEKNYGKLVASVLPLLRPGGILFASTNAQKLSPEKFLADVRAACATVGRKILQEQFIPQPPDFPISREEPAYLKTVWLRIQ